MDITYSIDITLPGSNVNPDKSNPPAANTRRADLFKKERGEISG